MFANNIQHRQSAIGTHHPFTMSDRRCPFATLLHSLGANESSHLIPQ